MPFAFKSAPGADLAGHADCGRAILVLPEHDEAGSNENAPVPAAEPQGGPAQGAGPFTGMLARTEQAGEPIVRGG